MDVTATNDDPVHKSNSPQYLVFTWSLPTAARSKKTKAFATYIYTSLKKLYNAETTRTRIFIKILVDPSKPVLEVRGMIWASVDEELPSNRGVLPLLTIEDLQNRIRRQARRASLKIGEEVAPRLELNPLSDKVAAGHWAYTVLDVTIYSSSFFGDEEFVYLITAAEVSYNAMMEASDRMKTCTGENFGWIKYANGGRFGLPTGQVSSYG